MNTKMIILLLFCTAHLSLADSIKNEEKSSILIHGWALQNEKLLASPFLSNVRPTGNFIFYDKNHEPLVVIHADGYVETRGDIEKSAALFWEAVRKIAPVYNSKVCK